MCELCLETLNAIPTTFHHLFNLILHISVLPHSIPVIGAADYQHFVMLNHIINYYLHDAKEIVTIRTLIKVGDKSFTL